jgi:hypothetical protein
VGSIEETKELLQRGHKIGFPRDLPQQADLTNARLDFRKGPISEIADRSEAAAVRLGIHA